MCAVLSIKVGSLTVGFVAPGPLALISDAVNPSAPVPSASEKLNVTSKAAFARSGPPITTVGALSTGLLPKAIARESCGVAGAGITVVPAVAAFLRTETVIYPAVFAAGVILTV